MRKRGRPRLGKRAIHATIRTRRKALGLSQSELADKMDVDKSVVSQWESEGYAPSASRIAQLAEILLVSENRLLRELSA